MATVDDGGYRAQRGGSGMPETFALFLPDEAAPVRLMNTIWADRRGVHDALQTPGDLHAWLLAAGEHDPSAHEPTEADLRRFLRLRDALRKLTAFVTADSRPVASAAPSDLERAVGDLNHAVTQATTFPQVGIHDGQLRRHTASAGAGPTRSLSRIAAEAVDLLTGPAGERLRACYAPGCVLYFSKDHPRREWCSVNCGNRARAARHYQRHRARSHP